MESLIRNKNYVKQAIDFTGIGNKKIHPSDIDCVLEFNDRYLILMEFKFEKEGVIIPIGQQLLLERISKAWDKSDSIKKSVILKVIHNSKDDIILAKNCKVTEIYSDKKWFKTKMGLKKCLLKLGEKWDCEKLKLMF